MFGESRLAAQTACLLVSVWHMRRCGHDVRSVKTGCKVFGDSGLLKFVGAVTGAGRLGDAGLCSGKCGGLLFPRFGRHWVRGLSKRGDAAAPAATNAGDLALFAEPS
jgi:hypothetical protein